MTTLTPDPETIRLNNLVRVLREKIAKRRKWRWLLKWMNRA